MLDALIQLQEQIMVPDRIPYAVAAIALVSGIGLMTGPLGHNANPFLFFIHDALWGKIGDRLDKTQRGKGDLVFRGFLLTVFVLVMTSILIKLADLAIVAYPHFGAVDILLLSACLSSGSVWRMMRRLRASLQSNSSQKAAFLTLSRSSRVDLNSTDNFGITRCGLCYLANSYDKSMVNPVFWYVFGGLPFVFVYNALAFLAWRFGKCGFTKGLGAVPLALEKLMGFVPSLMAGALLTLASALTPTAKLHKSLMAWWSVREKAPYEQGGIILSALAWPLHITIGGAVVDVTGSSLQNAWIGPEGATAQVDFNHISRALYLSVVAHLLYVFTLLGAYIYGVGFF